MHTYIHTYIHPYIHTYIHTYIHAYIQIHICENVFAGGQIYNLQSKATLLKAS